MSSKLQRFLAVKDRFELTDEQFAKRIGVSRSNINKIKAGQKIEGKTLTGLFNGFPSLNKDWFIYGTGEMLVDDNEVKLQIASEPKEEGFYMNATKAFTKYYEQMELIKQLMVSKQDEFLEVYSHLTKSV